jgi:hypothetical protein
VQGFADFEHGVIGRINKVTDRADASQSQTSLNDIGAGADLHVADQAEDKAGVEFRIFDLDLNLLCNGITAGFQ